MCRPEAPGTGPPMTVYVAWTSADLEGTTGADLAGPWRDVWVAANGVVLVDSDETLSRVYHELKWSLPEGAALLVTPAGALPKLKGLRAGTTTWLRARLGPADNG